MTQVHAGYNYCRNLDLHNRLQWGRLSAGRGRKFNIDALLHRTRCMVAAKGLDLRIGNHVRSYDVEHFLKLLRALENSYRLHSGRPSGVKVLRSILGSVSMAHSTNFLFSEKPGLRPSISWKQLNWLIEFVKEAA